MQMTLVSGDNGLSVTVNLLHHSLYGTRLDRHNIPSTFGPTAGAKSQKVPEKLQSIAPIL